MFLGSNFKPLLHQVMANSRGFRPLLTPDGLKLTLILNGACSMNCTCHFRFVAYLPTNWDVDSQVPGLPCETIFFNRRPVELVLTRIYSMQF